MASTSATALFLRRLGKPRKAAFYIRYCIAPPSRRPLRLYLFPDALDRRQLLWKLIRLCDMRLTRDAPAADIACVHQPYATWMNVDDALWPPMGVRVLNGRCVDISKRRVQELHGEAFGYTASVDPRGYRGEMVVKSDENARHDGQIIGGPIDQPRPGCVYERLIDNEVASSRGGRLVEDLRVTIIGGRAPVAYRKRRPKGERFRNINTEADIVAPEEILSADELAATMRLAQAIGLDIGEIDLLRDRETARLYAVDVNKTPNSPPGVCEGPRAWGAMEKVAVAFREQFLTPEFLRAGADDRADPRVSASGS